MGYLGRIHETGVDPTFSDTFAPIKDKATDDLKVILMLPMGPFMVPTPLKTHKCLIASDASLLFIGAALNHRWG